MDALWCLTALARDEFNATYGAMMARSWRYMAAPEGERWASLKPEALTCAVVALRVRQAHVLPRFAAAEDAARLAEVMSFALAAAVPRSLPSGSVCTPAVQRQMAGVRCPTTFPPRRCWTTARYLVATARRGGGGGGRVGVGA